MYILVFAPESAFGEAVDDLLLSFGAWALILAALGFGRRRLSSSSSFLEYASPAVLPFYILHQTVLLCAGFYILRWDIPDYAEVALDRHQLLRRHPGLVRAVRAAVQWDALPVRDEAAA
jgi:hypothetical protein